MYFYTSLEKANKEHIYLVIECVIIGSKDYKSDGDKELKYLAGGYANCSLFSLGQKEQQINLHSGSPREMLMMDIEQKSEDKTVSLMLWSNIGRYDNMKALIPQNVLVSEEDRVPGLYDDFFPKFEPKDANPKKQATPVEMQERQTLYISNLQIQGNINVEQEIETILKKMHSQKLITKSGDVENYENYQVNIKERRLKVKCHNGWRYVSAQQTANLDDPDIFGVFKASSTIYIRDFIPHSHVGIIFELEFTVEIGKGGGIYNVCIGFQFFMPEITSSGIPADQQFTINLLKGPMETVDNELCLAEEALVNQHDNLLEFALTGYMSAKDTRPLGSDASMLPPTWQQPV